MDPDLVFVRVKFHPLGPGGWQESRHSSQNRLRIADVSVIARFDIPFVVQQQMGRICQIVGELSLGREQGEWRVVCPRGWRN